MVKIFSTPAGFEPALLFYCQYNPLFGILRLTNPKEIDSLIYVIILVDRLNHSAKVS